jgi:hypothetical protein
MNENILMLLSLEEISNTVKGLKIALQHINNEENVDDKLREDINNMLKKMLYVESEYSKKGD